MYALWGGTPVVLTGFSVLIAHEYAHYWWAKGAGATVKTPVFIPLIITITGATYIANPDPSQEKAIALVGSLVGLGTVCIIGVLMISFGLTSTVLFTLAGLATYEVVSVTFGSDGKRYRRINRRLNASRISTTG